MKTILATFFGIVTIFLVSPALATPGDLVYLQVKASKLRQAPQHWADSVKDLSFGDELKEVSQQDGWLKVSTLEGKIGYVHQTAVSPKRVVFKGQVSPENVAADASDIVLAGKGFNQDIEDQLSSTDQALNYQAVDQVEKVGVSPDELRSFMVEGNLSDDQVNENKSVRH